MRKRKHKDVRLKCYVNTTSGLSLNLIYPNMYTIMPLLHIRFLLQITEHTIMPLLDTRLLQHNIMRTGRYDSYTFIIIKKSNKSVCISGICVMPVGLLVYFFWRRHSVCSYSALLCPIFPINMRVCRAFLDYVMSMGILKDSMQARWQLHACVCQQKVQGTTTVL